MDLQETQVFKPTWGVRLPFIMKFTVLPIAGLAIGYMISFKGIDVGAFILVTLFTVLFLAVALMACTAQIIITPIAVVNKNIFMQRSIPIPGIQRVRLQQGVPHSSIKMLYVLIETSEKKHSTGGKLFTAEQQQDIVDLILAHIRDRYTQNYELVLRYSNDPSLVLEGSPNATIVDPRVGRVFAPSRAIKILLLLPFLLVTLILFIDIPSVLTLVLPLICALPFMGIWFRKITISSSAVVSQTLWGKRSIPLGAIRVARIVTESRNLSKLMIQSDRAKLSTGSGLTGSQLDEALAYLLELIRVNHPENYEMVRQSGFLGERLGRR